MLLMVVAIAGVSMAIAEKYKIPVGEFSEISLNDNLNVVYSCNPDSVGFVVFDTKSGYAPYIMTECNKGRLRIQLDQEAVGLPDLPTVYAYSSYLMKAENLRDSTLTIRDIKPTSKVQLVIQGNGKISANGLDAVSLSLKIQSGKGSITAAGKCRSLEVVNIGVGKIDALNVVADDADCRMVGTGAVYCPEVKTLTLRGLGTGKVYYKGTPRIDKKSLSTIKAFPLAESETAADDESDAEEAEPTVVDGDDATHNI